MKASITSCRNGIWGEEPSGEGDDIDCVRVADFDRVRLVVDGAVPTRRRVTAAERAGRILKRGDLLLEKSGGGEKQPVGQVVLYDRDEPAICSNFVAKVALADGMIPRFWTYQHAAAYTCGVNVGAIKQTSGIQNLDQSQYFEERGVFPPRDEQVAIAAFLDRETAKIDALIAEQEKLLALLAEKRQATISHAVTRGLDPSVSMKDSGVLWLGQVPAHWEVRRVKDVSRLESGHTPSKQVADYWVNCHIPWVSLNDSKQLASSDYISDTAVQINDAGLANSSARLLPSGTVVFTRDATIGLAAITTREMAVSQHVIAWCPTGAVTALYLLRAFNAMKRYLDSLSTGATLKTIGMPEVKRLVMPVPPVSEQVAITHFLEQQIARIDQLVEEARSAVGILKERRSALITAAVTGQIDVRDASRGVIAA